MRFHQAISVLVLATFLPFAVGCSSQRTVRLDSDPGEPSLPIASNESVAILGYTTVDSEFHEWDGQMRVVGADSLEFTRNPALKAAKANANRPPDSTTDEGSEMTRLGLAQVASVDIVDSHPGRTIALGFGVFVLLFTAMAAIDIAQNGLY